MYVAKDRVPEQSMLGKPSKCNSFFSCTIFILIVAKIAIACLIFGESEQNQKNIIARALIFIGTCHWQKICNCSTLRIKNALHTTHACMHGHIHTHRLDQVYSPS